MCVCHQATILYSWWFSWSRKCHLDLIADKRHRRSCLMSFVFDLHCLDVAMKDTSLLGHFKSSSKGEYTWLTFNIAISASRHVRLLQAFHTTAFPERDFQSQPWMTAALPDAFHLLHSWRLNDSDLPLLQILKRNMLGSGYVQVQSLHGTKAPHWRFTSYKPRSTKRSCRSYFVWLMIVNLTLRGKLSLRWLPIMRKLMSSSPTYTWRNALKDIYHGILL